MLLFPVLFSVAAAVTMIATFVASPQAFNYDLIPACAAALVLWRRDPIPWLGLGLAMLVWATPVVMLGLEHLHAPVAPLVLTAAMIRLATLPSGSVRMDEREMFGRKSAAEPVRDLQ